MKKLALRLKMKIIPKIKLILLLKTKQSII